MIDFLMKYPDVETATAAGVALGTTDPESAETFPFAAGLNLSVIGRHAYRTGGTDEAPEMTEVPGWWVLGRVAEDHPLALELPPDLAAVIVWRSDSGAPRPDWPDYPDRVWA
ncbi:hypothetical protein HNR46_001599 [Haloferula luteola]|uniref:Uncharacterized protein n=1 Tax=Haloferula luteola TaxID=595692 RepID=A0A840V1S7_9BACT|nr:hypothetical protein [Haloferula luteola]MBB5351363.1 hypothetical protein [Haloferula luteola]